MTKKPRSIRAFIGSRNFEESRAFYREIGFQELRVSDDMCYFQIGTDIGFYLQDYYVTDWVANTMMFLEVDDLDAYWENLQQLHLPGKYKGVKLSAIQDDSWGRECFLHDPSGVLWHVGQFNR